MEYIQFNKSDYQMLNKYLLGIPNLYSSANRRIYICKLSLQYSQNKVTVEAIHKDIKYFKKLRAEATENALNTNAERLTEVITILEKYQNKL